MITEDQIIDETFRRELPPRVTWDEARAVSHVADRGGYTRGGITASSWGEHAQLGRRATPAELDAITEPQARAFYKGRYVRVFSWVPDETLRLMMVDWGVTSGPDDPTRAMQRSLKDRGIYTGIVDGVAGPKTRAAALHDDDMRQTYRDVLNAREDFYVRLALEDRSLAIVIRHARRSDDPSVRTAARKLQLLNLAGWLNRTQQFHL